MPNHVVTKDTREISELVSDRDDPELYKPKSFGGVEYTDYISA